MSAPNVASQRKTLDLNKLIQAKHQVTMLSGINEFSVKFFGPAGTPYEGGIWNVVVLLPDNYPFESPSIGFANKIYHPNIDEESGTVCLDVINQTWTPIYDLSNIFETFLPQLLLYPNASDPLNQEAAKLLLHKPKEYKDKVISYVQQHATEVAFPGPKKEPESTDSESSMSDNNEDITDM